jgi:transposase
LELPGADQYEQQYRSRVLANLQRRAKSLGFMLQAIPGDANAAVFRKAAAFFAREAT